jgi:hypothetical protein
MTDHELPDLLDRLASRHAVGAPPTGAMLAAASRRHRRRATWAAVGTIGAAAAVMAAGVMLPRLPDGRTPPQGVPLASSPGGLRLVGVGHLGIRVPDSWGTNAVQCGQPTADTVVVNGAMSGGDSRACLITNLTPVETVQLLEGDLSAHLPLGADVSVAGQSARRSSSICEASRPAHCMGEVYFPDADVSFVAGSSTAERVEEILDRIVALGPDQVPVPGRSYLAGNRRSGPATSAQDYAVQLRALGLVPELVPAPHPGWPIDYIVSVEPETGTILQPGDKVTVTYVPPDAGPADLVIVSGNSVGPGGSLDYQDLTDAQIRAGVTIHLKVGSRLWVYAQGDGAQRLTGAFNTNLLKSRSSADGPGRGRACRGRSPGRAPPRSCSGSRATLHSTRLAPSL